MGNSQGLSVKHARPQQFVTQAHFDWSKQMEELFKSRPTITKTVILPPGVQLSDPRLAKGVVVSEKKYRLPAGAPPEWPSDIPFECDIDGRLLPPCWGQSKTHAHYAVYPNKHFSELNCEYCQMHQEAHPEDKEFTMSLGSASLTPTKERKSFDDAADSTG